MRAALAFFALPAFVALAAFPPSQNAQDPYGDFIAKTGPRTPAEEQKCFHLPPGFAIELVASEPDIGKPIDLNFDDRGRIWMTQSVEYPFPAPPDRKSRDMVKILEDTKGTGKFDRITTFTDGLNIPICVLPVTRGAILYSIPNIYRYTDVDGDDHADKRELLYGSVGFRDTHGMTGSFTIGFDGWIYACHGFSNTSELKGRDGSVVKMESGNTYRMKADGSHVEQFTHGQVNPFGLAFDPLGNLYSADCHTQPVMMLLRGGWYQSFGKPDDGLGFAPEICSGYDRSTAIAGIVYYAADHYPPPYRDCLFFGDVVANQVNQFVLEKHGSSFKAKLVPSFLTCDDPWFRPVDVKLGLDGALYIADFYNRIIGHYEVPLTHPGRDRDRGRIWRIVYRGTDGKNEPRQPRPDWSKATVAELASDLGHPNLFVRMKATNQLVERGGAEGTAAAQALMQPGSSPLQRMHALWVLERLHALDAPTLEAAIHDPEAGVRVHAMRVLAGRADLPAPFRELTQKALRDPNPFVQRCATEALGTHPSADNVMPLLELRHAVPADDTHLLYQVRMALRNQLLPPSTWQQLPITTWNEWNRRAIADVAAGAGTSEAAAFLVQHVKEFKEPQEKLIRYVHHVARYGLPEAIVTLLDFARGAESGNIRLQAALLKAIYQGAQERGGKLSEPAMQWASGLVHRLLESQRGGEIQAGTDLAGLLQLKAERAALLRIAADKRATEQQRQSAMDALMGIDSPGMVTLLGGILTDASERLALQEHAVHLLARINQPDAQAELLKSLAVAPARLQTAVAGGLVANEQGAKSLLDSVAAGKASARLLQEWWVHMQLQKYDKLKDQVVHLTQGLPTADQRLQEILSKRRAGYAQSRPDAALGAAVFEKSCAICHQLGGKGAKVGPQLDGVGVRGLDRLLEDLIDPNRNVDQAFRSTTLALKNGQVVSGLVLREEGEVLVLADTQGKEVRVPKNTVEERAVSQLSPMPANLVDQIPESDFYNLLAFLLAQRSAPGK